MNISMILSVQVNSLKSYELQITKILITKWQ